MRVLYNSILLSKFANSNIYRTMKMAKLKIWMVALTLIMGVFLVLMVMITLFNRYMAQFF